MSLDLHDAPASPSPAPPRAPLGADELLDLARSCGADDCGLVSIDDPALAEERPHIARLPQICREVGDDAFVGIQKTVVHFHLVAVRLFREQPPPELRIRDPVLEALRPDEKEYRHFRRNGHR